MIVNLQVARALAAIAIVFYHTGYTIPGGVHTTFDGVAVFFVLSGFLMTFITRDQADGFLYDRFARIAPIYWIATAFAFAWFRSGLGNPLYVGDLIKATFTSDAWVIPRTLIQNLSTSASAVGMLLRSMFFVPMPAAEGPMLGVGWSLNLEVAYYLLFAVALQINRTFAPLIVAAVLLLARPWNGPCGMFCSFYVNEAGPWFSGQIARSNDNFALGIGLYYLWAFAGRALEGKKLAVWPLAIAFAGYYLWRYGAGTVRPLESRFLPAGVILVALALERAGARCSWRPLILLGNASYALYLVHIIVIETIRPVGNSNPGWVTSQNILAALFAIEISIVVAIAVHMWVERPIMRALHRGHPTPSPVLQAARTAPAPG